MKIRQTAWQVAVRKRIDGSCILDDKGSKFFAIRNPFGKWAADPFIIEDDSKLYIFAELFNVLKWKADIAYCVFENNKFSKWNIIISDKHHFSFPYIFQNDKKIYIIPETSKIDEISLYTALEFPHIWVKEKVISKQGCFADTIILDTGDFLTYRVLTKQLPKLALLRKHEETCSILEEKIDFENNLRPAGKVFKYKEKNIRPVQDCSHLYGGAIEFNEITLNKNSLPTEKFIDRVDPEDIKVINIKNKLTGLHTYNNTSNYEVIDVQYERFNLLDLLKRAQLKLCN